jgi:hypothetical protein
MSTLGAFPINWTRTGSPFGGSLPIDCTILEKKAHREESWGSPTLVIAARQKLFRPYIWSSRPALLEQEIFMLTGHVVPAGIGFRNGPSESAPTLLEPGKCHVHDLCDCCRPRAGSRGLGRGKHVHSRPPRYTVGGLPQCLSHTTRIFPRMTMGWRPNLWRTM